MRPVELLKKSEAYALLYGEYTTCPSVSMSKALSTVYQIVKQPTAIFNSFSLKENACNFRFDRPTNSLIWFSQVVGAGRGLETLISAIKEVKKPLSIHLVGKYIPGYKEVLIKLLGRSIHQLHFHDAVKHFELQPFISQFNIGLAIENNFPDNRDTTISNKILQYIQAGNKVLATNTKGQSELAESFKEIMVLVDVEQPKKWANAIEELLLLTDNDIKKQLHVYKNKFSWEIQEKMVSSLVKEAID